MGYDIFMRKIKFGSVELLGFIGILVWVCVTYIRTNDSVFNPVFSFVIGILPNLGAAWTMTMFGKWTVLIAMNRRYSLKKHAAFCIGVLAAAVLSEYLYDVFLQNPFDIYDILLTVIAQLIMFILPVLTKDKYLESYDE